MLLQFSAKALINVFSKKSVFLKTCFFQKKLFLYLSTSKVTFIKILNSVLCREEKIVYTSLKVVHK